MVRPRLSHNRNADLVGKNLAVRRFFPRNVREKRWITQISLRKLLILYRLFVLGVNASIELNRWACAIQNMKLK